MSNQRTQKVSVSLDHDLIVPSKKRSVELGVSRYENLSAYVNYLIRRDLESEPKKKTRQDFKATS